jgi:hypothetical protein
VKKNLRVSNSLVVLKCSGGKQSLGWHSEESYWNSVVMEFVWNGIQAAVFGPAKRHFCQK